MNQMASDMESGAMKLLTDNDKVPKLKPKCGVACNKNETVLSPVDLVMLCSQLKQHPAYVLDKYMDIYYGENSGLPCIVMKGLSKGACDFLAV